MKANRQVRREATQLFRDCLVNGLLDENRVRMVVRQLIDSKPRDYLATLDVFRRLVELDAAQHMAKVESAVPLSPDLQTRVRTDLTRVYGPGLNTSFTENRTLIGGMRIQVGSDVYDGSVLGRLTALEQSF